MYGLMLLGADTICQDSYEMIQLVGKFLTIFKIAIPLIIIGLGLFDLGKAAVSSKPEEIKKSATSLIWRFVGGIAIFFIPAIVMLIFRLAGPWNELEESGNLDFDVCYNCIISPWGSGCHGK